MNRFPTTEAISSYLTATGWQLVDGPHPALRTFSRGEEVVSVPLEPEFSDFELRMEMLLSRIASSQEVSPFELPDRVNDAAFDNIRWSVLGERMVGSIPLTTLESVMQAVKKLHTYAAASLEQRVAMHGRRVSRRARAVADRLHLGPTVPGSYVLPVRFESTTDLPTRLLNQLSEPNFATYSFEQRSMDLLLSALRTVAQLVHPVDNATQIGDLEIVRQGLSHEFVASLADLLRSPHVSAISVSGTVFGEAKTGVQGLHSKSLVVLDALAERLFDSRLDGVDDVRGVVVLLRRTSPGEGGQVRVRRTDMGEKGTVLLVDLQERDYLLAGEADAYGREIEVRGRIVSEPKALPRLVDVERVTALDDQVF